MLVDIVMKKINNIMTRSRYGCRLFCVCLAAFFWTCSSTRYAQPDLELPSAYRGHVNPASADSAETIARLSYRAFFSDAELLQLIDSGLTRNNNLLIAMKQIESAEQSMKQAKWGYIPVVDLSVGPATITRPSDNSMNGMLASQFLGSSTIEDYSSALSLSWEADVWGKIKGQKEASLAAYLESQEGAKAVRTRLIADIAHGYYNLLMLDMQLGIANENLSLVDSTLVMMKLQYDWGMTNILAVEQQESARDQLLNALHVIKQNIALQENALSVLTGTMPGAIKRKSGPEGLAVPQSIPTGIPAEMLALRPDVRSRELAVRRAAAMTHVAKVNMYPSFRISAQGGVNAFKASNWFDIPGSLFGVASGTILQPVLQGRRLKTAYEQAQIATEQAELQFKETVLQAVGEVSSTLAQLESLGEQAEISGRLANRSEEVVKNSLVLFNNGMATYLEVMAAQSGKLQAELSLADVQRQQLSAVVTLYRALGGGWE